MRSSCTICHTTGWESHRKPPLVCLWKELLQILSKLALQFLAFVHFTSVLHCGLRWKRTSFSQWSIYTGKCRMTWNTTNWKPLLAQSSRFASILFCFTIYVRCTSVNSSRVYSAMAFTKSFGRCYQDNILSDDIVTFLKDNASSDSYQLRAKCYFFSLEICMR